MFRFQRSKARDKNVAFTRKQHDYRKHAKIFTNLGSAPKHRGNKCERYTFYESIDTINF